MKFLLDQDVYAVTIQYLRDAGHNVLLAADLGMSRAADIDLLHKAHELGRIFVTRDSDFGRLIFAGGEAAGVIFLRMTPLNHTKIHTILTSIIDKHDSTTLRQTFIVINSKGYRIRWLK